MGVWNVLMDLLPFEWADHGFMRSALLAVVTGNVYAGGMDYAAQTRAWLAELARLERKLAAAAEQVWEVVCGIPVGWKGEAV